MRLNLKKKKKHALIFLTGQISKEDTILGVAWLLLAAFYQVYREKSNLKTKPKQSKTEQKGNKMQFGKKRIFIFVKF